MTIKRITRYSPKLHRELYALLAQLWEAKKTVSPAYLKSVFKDKNVHVMGFYEKDVLIGTATLVIQRNLPGLDACLESVVLDEKYRGQGLGKKMILEMIKLAKRLGARDMEFTSRPERIVANKMYQSMGFEKRNTNVYRMKFKTKNSNKKKSHT